MLENRKLSQPLHELIARRFHSAPEELSQEVVGEREDRVIKGAELERIATHHSDLFLVLYTILRGEPKPAFSRNVGVTRSLDRLQELYETVRQKDAFTLAFLFPHLQAAQLEMVKRTLKRLFLPLCLSEQIHEFFNRLDKYLKKQLQESVTSENEWKSWIEDFVGQYFHKGGFVPEQGKFGRLFGGYLGKHFKVSRNPLEDQERIARLHRLRIAEEFPQFVQDERMVSAWVQDFQIPFEQQAEEFKRSVNNHETFQAWQAEFKKEFLKTSESNRAEATVAFSPWAERIKSLQPQHFSPVGRAVNLLEIPEGEEYSLAELAIYGEDWESLFILAKVAEREGQKLMAVSRWARDQKKKALVETFNSLNTLYIASQEAAQLPETGGNEQAAAVPENTQQAVLPSLSEKVAPEKVELELKKVLAAWREEVPLSQRLTYFPAGILTPTQVQSLVGEDFSHDLSKTCGQLGDWKSLLSLKNIGVIGDQEIKRALNTVHPLSGNTCLHHCVRERDLEGIVFCLEKEAEGRIKNKAGERPFEVTSGPNEPRFLQWLWREIESDKAASNNEELAKKEALFELCIKKGKASPFFLLGDGRAFLNSIVDRQDCRARAMMSFLCFTVIEYFDHPDCGFRELKGYIAQHPDLEHFCGIEAFETAMSCIESYFPKLNKSLLKAASSPGRGDVLGERSLKEVIDYLSVAEEAYRTGKIDVLFEKVKQLVEEGVQYPWWTFLVLEGARSFHNQMIKHSENFSNQSGKLSEALAEWGQFKQQQAEIVKWARRTVAAEQAAAEAKAAIAKVEAEAKAQVAEVKAEAATAVAGAKAEAARAVAGAKAEAATAVAGAKAKAAEDTAVLRKEFEAFRAQYSSGSSNA